MAEITAKWRILYENIWNQKEQRKLQTVGGKEARCQDKSTRKNICYLS